MYSVQCTVQGGEITQSTVNGISSPWSSSALLFDFDLLVLLLLDLLLLLLLLLALLLRLEFIPTAAALQERVVPVRGGEKNTPSLITITHLP